MTKTQDTSFSDDELDRLASPEGGLPIEPSAQLPKGGDDGAGDDDGGDDGLEEFAGTPVLKGNEDKGSDDSKGDKTDDDEFAGLEDDEQAGAGDEPPKGKEGEPTVFAKLAAEMLTEHLGTTNIDVPKDLDKKDLVPFLQKQLAPKLHPAARALQETLNNGGTVNDFLQGLTVYDQLLSKDDEWLVALEVTQRFGKSDANKHGLDEQGIKAYVERLKASGELQLRAVELRNNIEANKAKHFENMTAESEPAKKVDVSSPEFKAGFDKDFDHFFQQAFSESKLYGITHDKKDKFVSGVKNLAYKALFPDKETGMSDFQKALNDRKELLRIAALWQMGRTGRLKADLSRSNRNLAKEVAKALDAESKGGKARGQQQANGFDASVLAALTAPTIAG